MTEPTTQRIPLHSNQLNVFKDGEKYRFRVLVTGRRFGKTTLAITELVIKALRSPNKLYWYCGPTYRQSKQIAWKMVKSISPEGDIKKINESELTVLYHNGSEVQLKGCDNMDSLRGSGVHGMIVDEFAAIYNNWEVWNEVLRPTLSDAYAINNEDGWCMFIGTPKGKDALFNLFLRGQKVNPVWKSYQFTTIDNMAINMRSEVELAKKELPGRMFRQEYLASFESFTGLIYPEFSNDHVVTKYELPKWFKKLACIDPAVTGTTAVLFTAIDEDGTIICYNEYYEDNQRVSEVCANLPTSDDWLIDPASNAKVVHREGKLFSLHDEYRENGIVARNGENDVDGGINRVGEYFKTNRIRVMSNCTKLIWELERYHWSEQKETIKGETKATPFKKNDHLCDCLRYIVMSRPHDSKLNIERKAERHSPAWFEMKDKMDANDWRDKY